MTTPLARRALAAGSLLLVACGDGPGRQEAPTGDVGPTDEHDQDVVVPPCTSGPFALVEVRPGTFTMGSPSDEAGRLDNEDAHPVTLTKGFCAGATEVTQDSFTEVMGTNPSGNTACGGSCPVEKVTWYQAAAYANKLSEAQGLEACYTCTDDRCEPAKSPLRCTGYRLPTEAEWEYAARASVAAAFQNGDEVAAGWEQKCPTETDVPTTNQVDELAWTFCSTRGASTMPVASLAPNAWGLYDVSGNVWEWTHDVYVFDLPEAPQTDPVGGTPDHIGGVPLPKAAPLPTPADAPAMKQVEPTHTVRGGSYQYYPRYARLSYRAGGTADLVYEDLGFRVVRTIP